MAKIGVEVGKPFTEKPLETTEVLLMNPLLGGVDNVPLPYSADESDIVETVPDAPVFIGLEITVPVPELAKRRDVSLP